MFQGKWGIRVDYWPYLVIINAVVVSLKKEKSGDGSNRVSWKTKPFFLILGISEAE